MALIKKLPTGLITFLIILSVACCLRLYRFPYVPPSLNWDEVSIGYNAWSILTTGRDEYGTFLPKFFRSLDDYKPPVYIYLTVPVIANLGPTDAAVRLPSLLAGISLIVVVYMFVREIIILENAKYKKSAIFPALLTCPEPYLAALIVSIMPWTVQFSRMASEANVGALFLFTAIIFFLWGLRKNVWNIPIAIILLTLSSYTYQSYRILAPLTGALLFVIFWKRLPKERIVRMISIALVFGAGVSMATDLLNPDVQARLQGTSVISHQMTAWGDTPYHRNQKEMAYDATLGINKTRRLFHDNQFFWGGGLILSGYFSHFSPEFLFFDSTQKWNHTPFIGLLNLFLLPFIVIGINRVSNRFSGKVRIIFFGLMLLVPVPAAVTYDVPHPIRVFPLAAFFAVLASFGIAAILDLNKTGWRNIIYVVIIGVALFSVFRYTHQYFIHLPAERASRWQYGRRELANFLVSDRENYDRVIFMPELEWPHIFMLWYMKYDPAQYLTEGGTVSGGFAAKENKFSVFEFRDVSEADKASGERIFVAGPTDKVQGLGTPVYLIDNPEGSPALMVRML